MCLTEVQLEGRLLDAPGRLNNPPGSSYAELVRGSPTPSRPGDTRSLVTATSPYTSLLPVSDGTDIAALATGAPVARPLVEQLQLLFEAFFSTAAQSSQEPVQIQVGYSYSLAGDLEPQVQVPIARVPSQPFVVPADWSPGTACQDVAEDSALVCQIAAVIRGWFEQNAPSAGDAQLTFDLSATPSSSLPPVVVSGLTLPLADITDL